jgi:hypothetical protein
MRAGVADCIIANGAAPASLSWDGAKPKNRKDGTASEASI